MLKSVGSLSGARRTRRPRGPTRPRPPARGGRASGSAGRGSSAARRRTGRSAGRRSGGGGPARSRAAPRASSSYPGFSFTTASTSSSVSSEGTPTTAVSSTASLSFSTCSTSHDEMFSPRRRIASLRRSTNVNQPSSSCLPRSPVWNQIPRNASAVAAGSPQYSSTMMCGSSGRTTNSPSTPGGTAAAVLVVDLDDAVRRGPAARPELPLLDGVLDAGAELGRAEDLDQLRRRSAPRTARAPPRAPAPRRRRGRGCRRRRAARAA